MKFIVTLDEGEDGYIPRLVPIIPLRLDQVYQATGGGPARPLATLPQLLHGSHEECIICVFKGMFKEIVEAVDFAVDSQGERLWSEPSIKSKRWGSK